MKKIVKLYQYSMAYLQRVLREKVGLWPSPLVRVVSAASLAWGERWKLRHFRIFPFNKFERFYLTINT